MKGMNSLTVVVPIWNQALCLAVSYRLLESQEHSVMDLMMPALQPKKAGLSIPGPTITVESVYCIPTAG